MEIWGHWPPTTEIWGHWPPPTDILGHWLWTFGVTDPLLLTFGVTDPIIMTFGVTDPIILTFGITGPPPTDIWGHWPPLYWHLGSLTPSYWHLGSLTPFLLTFGVTYHPLLLAFGVTDPPPTDIWGHWTQPACWLTCLKMGGLLLLSFTSMETSTSEVLLGSPPSLAVAWEQHRESEQRSFKVICIWEGVPNNQTRVWVTGTGSFLAWSG